MGNKKSSVLLHQDEYQQISAETGFSASQVERFYARFLHLDRLECGKLSRWDLLSIPELAINPLCERLMKMFFPNGDTEERITFRQFVGALSAASEPQGLEVDGKVLEERRWERRDSLHSRTRLSEGENDNLFEAYANPGRSSAAIHCCSTATYEDWWHGLMFKVYDVDRDGRVGLEDVRSILRLMVGKHVEEAQLERICQRLVGAHPSGFIDYQHFCAALRATGCAHRFRFRLLS